MKRKMKCPVCGKRAFDVFYITVNADGKPVDTIVNELVPKLKLALANLQENVIKCQEGLEKQKNMVYNI